MKYDPLDNQIAALETLKASLGELAEGDPDLLLDMAEGETTLLEQIDRVITRIAELDTHADAVGEQIERLKGRKARFESMRDLLRGALAQSLTVLERKKLERPACTLSMADSAPQLVVTDESAIPARFWKKPDPVLDKVALRKALADKEAVEGAVLNNAPPRLTMRFR